MKFSIYFLLCLPSALLGQNESNSKNISLNLGLIDFTMLDRQASPVVYNLTAPIAQLFYQHQNQKRILEFDAYFSLGQLKASDTSLPILDNDLGLSTTAAGLNIHYWKSINSNTPWQQLMGASFHYDFMIDFEAIGDFPWVIGQARVGLDYSIKYPFKNGNHIAASFGIPVFGVLTRMPYYNIPRTQGKVPGVASLFTEGTQLATWNNFQRVDLSVAYELTLNENWQLQPSYQFAWFHYTAPDEIYAYQHQLKLRLSYSF